jgi:hypothetical protein
MFITPTEDEIAAVKRLRTELDNFISSNSDNKISFPNENDETETSNGPITCNNLSDTTILRFYRGRKCDEEKALRYKINSITIGFLINL